MSQFLRLALAILVSLTAGCKSAEDFARNNSATAEWLRAHAGSPGLKVAGAWHSDDWGDAQFKQQGSRVTGILGGYPVGGVLNGSRLYLAITENGWTSYTAILTERPDGALAGTYSRSVPFSIEEERVIRLTRPGN
ncbi:MAG: hypothetical protein PHC88_01500 [Terrimicrobiaceae bacterium]|nr:hypothetical protein [Terrimicrobiaceae bacterium]